MLFKRWMLIGTVLVIAALVTEAKVNADTLTVTSAADDQSPGTLRQTIARAQSGDNIDFHNSLNGQTIRLSTARGTLIVDKTLNISASSLPSGITIDGNRSNGGNFTVLSTTAATTVSMTNLTITGGNAPEYGGGISTARTTPANSATLNLTDCRIQGNHSGFLGGGLLLGGHFTLLRTSVTNNDSNFVGGGIYSNAVNYLGMNASITDCNISNNVSQYGDGGAGIGFETVTISRTTFNNNSVISGYSGAYSGGGTVFDHCIFTNNHVSHNGGAIVTAGKKFTLNDCIFNGNSAALEGGAIAINEPKTFIANRCTFQENSSAGGFGGSAIKINTQVEGSSIQLINCTFVRNRNRAVVASDARNNEPLFESCTFDDNDAEAVNATSGYSTCRLRLSNCTLTANGVRQNRRVIDHRGGRLTVDHCQILNNAAGISSGSTLNVLASTIANNSQVGIRCEPLSTYAGVLRVENSTISGNRAPIGEPGIYIGGVMDAVIRNSTISGNTSNSGGFSGGVTFRQSFSSQETHLKLHACTITNNTGGTIIGSAGGLYVAPVPTAICEVSGCIIAGNHHNLGLAHDVSGAVLSFGNSVIGQSDGSAGWVGSDQTGDSSNPLDARLGSLANNGGPTLTHALLSDSPAIDSGVPSLVGRTDQRGVPRDQAPDAGSYEYTGVDPGFLRGFVRKKEISP